MWNFFRNEEKILKVIFELSCWSFNGLLSVGLGSRSMMHLIQRITDAILTVAEAIVQ